MFKVIKRLNNFFLDKKLIYFLFLFFLFLKTNHILSNDKIYLDLANIKFENKVNYKKYQTSSQLLIKTDLNKELQNWIKKNIILKGNSGKLSVQILKFVFSNCDLIKSPTFPGITPNANPEK